MCKNDVKNDVKNEVKNEDKDMCKNAVNKNENDEVYAEHVGENADSIEEGLMEAYNDLEIACLDIRDSKEFSELITDNLLSYMDSQATRFQTVDDKVQELKKQINIRGLLDPPKFGSWQNIGLNEEDWNQITASAKRNHHTDDDINQEEDEHDKAGCKSNDEEETPQLSGTCASPDLVSTHLEQRNQQHQLG